MKEVIGSIAMIGLTFSPGTWFGSSKFAIYLLHAAGVVFADKIFGGDVNPAVSACMFSLGKSNLPTFLTKVSAQLVGGIVGFAAFSLLSGYFSLTEFGGPALPKYATDDAVEVCVMNELMGTVLLLITIFTVNWEVVFVPDAEHNYYVKQTLTAAAIRVLILMFPNSGPSMNPMLASAFAINKNAAINGNHVLVYWIAPLVGAILAALAYVFYTGGEGAQFFGRTLKTAPRDKTKPLIAPVKIYDTHANPNSAATMKSIPDKASAATPPPPAPSTDDKKKEGKGERSKSPRSPMWNPANWGKKNDKGKKD
ncbi:hypothetical protein TrRE_jg13179 [Triparma retinervis]|uniref:Aquaporin n=1 Tax=Triparma retinervis TaxID=2557542 RepID=A0A9W7G3M5_9STRA|nr:hypothetical protein TrRE_jg13179 [Triparma retinervis]